MARKPAKTTRANDIRPSGGCSAIELRFIDGILAGKGSVQAAIDAGYAESSARKAAKQIRERPRVREEIARRQKAACDANAVDEARITRELALIAFADISTVADWGYGTDPDTGMKQGWVVVKSMEEIPPEARRIIAEVAQTRDGIRVKFASKIQALELLGKKLAMWTDKVQIEDMSEAAEKLKARRLAAQERADKLRKVAGG